jgi:DHA2 family multidrug resistance protein
VLAGVLAIWLLGRIDSRLVLGIGFTLIAAGCLLNAQLDSQWAGSSFWPSQLVLALGQGLALNGLVGSLILEVVNSGAVQQPINALTFSGFFQTIRLMGGEIGVAFMQHWISLREQTHSNLLGLHVQLADPATQHRLRLLQGGMTPHSTGSPEAAARAGALLSLQVRQQAFTLSIADCFLTLAWASVAALCVLACVGVMKIGFREARAANPS